MRSGYSLWDETTLISRSGWRGKAYTSRRVPEASGRKPDTLIVSVKIMVIPVPLENDSCSIVTAVVSRNVSAVGSPLVSDYSGDGLWWTAINPVRLWGLHVQAGRFRGDCFRGGGFGVGW